MSRSAPRAANFTSFLDRPIEEYQAPPPLPPGLYVAQVAGLPEIGQSSKKKTDQITFTLKLLEPVDFDEEQTNALNELGGLAGKTIQAVFYMTDNAGYRLKEFFEHLGIEVAGKSTRLCLDETPGKECIAVLGREPAQDPGDDRIFTRFKRSLPLRD